MALGKPTVYVSVPETQYLPPGELHPRRVRARKLGQAFRSGKRVVRFGGVLIAVTIVVVGGTQL